MKKLILVGALVCAGQMYGMEPQNPRPELGTFGYLPPELREKIIRDAIASSDTIEEAIKAINAASIQGVRYDNLKDFMKLARILANKYDNLKDFTKLVHILADKFNTSPYDIAKAFNMPIAERYIWLYDHFKDAVAKKQLARAASMILRGVDINAGQPDILYLALSTPPAEGLSVAKMIQLLLEHGANPYTKSGLYNETPLEFLNRNSQDFPEYEEIKSLLENAMKNYQK